MAVEYIGKNAPDGMVFGLASTDKIAFLGGTPSAQVTIAALASAATIATAVAQIQLIQEELESKGLIA
jgi:hypothetical protein